MKDMISQDKLILFAWSVMIMLFSMLIIFVIWMPDNRDTINSITETFKNMFIAIVSYYFGSSEGSKEKNKLFVKK